MGIIFKKSKQFSLRQRLNMIALGLVVIVASLFFMGQPWICACGDVKFWVGDIYSSENSQQIADWYTLSHFVHGLLVVLVFRLLRLRARRAMFLVALVTGVGWEVFEHTQWVIDQFRATTINQGYTGDTILNASFDFIWMMTGYAIARAMRGGWIFALIVIVELVGAGIGRDSLTLSTMQLLYPTQIVEDWQMGK